ncbi:MFS transporter [Caballeronia sp. LZ065]|uniref:MFS transporter n=1 Tax=Caballeronia sp. LZ065 TaxID=3038571 RepID=UPI00286684F2|nr:MFS transporter [Caballeronia sp. LZ065]MDR5781263.1 MFS transporter [Caballeronia sp. LZ065]
MASVSITIGMVCANLDMAIVQNALPAISTQMHIGSSASVWIITSYMLVTLTLLLPFAPLSDRIGYRRFYLGGFVVFIAASAICGLAGTFTSLLVGRLLQGIGSAAMMCSTTSLIRIVYPHARMARAIGTNSTVVAFSIAAAPSLSAAILLHLNWHWLFLINVPLGVLALALGARSLPAADANLRFDFRTWREITGSVDWLSVVINIAFFTLLLLGTEAIGTGPASGCAMLLAAGVLGYAFVRRQIRHEHPMLPFDLLAERNYRFTIATSFASFAAQGAAFVSLPFFMQRTAGLSTAQTAAVLTAWPVALAASAQVAGRLSNFVSTARLCATGQAMMAVGLGLIATGWLPGTMPAFAAALALCGAGFGMFQAPNNYVIVSSAPPGRSGAVGALRAATRTSGQLMGSALVGLAFLVARWFAGGDGPTLGIVVAAFMAAWASVFSLKRD